MPEHREGTPEDLRDLESFLWWDFDDLEIWRTWATKRGWSDASKSYNEALEVQEALRALQRANNGMELASAQVERVNRAIEAHGVKPQVSGSGDFAVGQSRADDPVGHVLSLAVLAMTRGVWRRFKVCRDEVCRASYYDATKNGAKTWCSMDTCGSRNKMRRYRAKGG